VRKSVIYSDKGRVAMGMGIRATLGRWENVGMKIRR
jgi:hypothetical protein